MLGNVYLIPIKISSDHVQSRTGGSREGEKASDNFEMRRKLKQKLSSDLNDGEFWAPGFKRRTGGSRFLFWRPLFLQTASPETTDVEQNSTHTLDPAFRLLTKSIDFGKMLQLGSC